MFFPVAAQQQMGSPLPVIARSNSAALRPVSRPWRANNNGNTVPKMVILLSTDLTNSRLERSARYRLHREIVPNSSSISVPLRGTGLSIVNGSNLVDHDGFGR